MARRTQKHWSYRTEEKGINRVRAFAHPVSGRLYLEFYDGDQRLTEPLRHEDKAEAKAQADRLAVALRQADRAPAAAATLQPLFDNYLREVTPGKTPGKAAHDRRTARMVVEILGGSRLVSSLTHRDAARFLAERRRRGDLRHGSTHGRKLGARQLAYDLAFIRAVLNWGVGAGLVDRNPWQGYRPDLGKYTPRRPVLNGPQYDALLLIAARVDPRFRLALVLAYETGHRVGAIRQLRWSDVDFSRGVIRWRIQHDKIGLEHETPMTLAAREELWAAQQAGATIGDQWVFPAPKNASEPVSRYLVDSWWDRGERLAELAPEPGRGWHSCRRTFATELKAAPLKDLCALGGWKDPQTILKCYQRADPVTMRQALATRTRLEA
jgi:integrase